MKRFLALLLTVMLLLSLMLSLAACGKEEESQEKEETSENKDFDKHSDNKKEDDDEEEDEKKDQDEEEEDTTPEGPTGEQLDKLIFDEKVDFEPGKPDKVLDPDEIYENLTYTPQMFYGRYRILGGEAGEEAFAEEMEYVQFQYLDYHKESVTKNITAVPMSITAGPHSFNHKISYVPGRNFLNADFIDENGNLETCKCLYTVEGNTLTLQPLAFYEYNNENNHIRFILSETVLSYEFRFEGWKLTLTDGENTVELHTAMETYTDDSWFGVDNYCASDSPMIENLEKLRFMWTWGDGEYTDNIRNAYGTEANNGDYHQFYAEIEENGLLTFSMEKDGQVITRQFVYFFCDFDGIILADGEDVYYYTKEYSDRHSELLGGNVTIEDLERLENMDEEKLEEIIETKANLFEDLTNAFRDAGISVTINTETGEIAMDATVLFAVNEYQVSEEGKALLKSFMDVYNSVVFNEKYDGFLSKIMVEGHTDSNGSYDSNLVLSQNRADSVKALCLEMGGEYTAQLEEMLQAVGYSSDKLIVDASGKEDRAASRRVCFRFIIDMS